METGRNGHARMKQHVNNYRMKKNTSVMGSYCEERHESNKKAFECNVRSVCRKVQHYGN